MKLTSDDVKEQMYKLAKKGLTPSQIGESGWKLHLEVLKPWVARKVVIALSTR